MQIEVKCEKVLWGPLKACKGGTSETGVVSEVVSEVGFGSAFPLGFPDFSGSLVRSLDCEQFAGKKLQHGSKIPKDDSGKIQ